MATGYNPYDTHQTILAGIKSPDLVIDGRVEKHNASWL